MTARQWRMKRGKKRDGLWEGRSKAFDVENKKRREYVLRIQQKS